MIWFDGAVSEGAAVPFDLRDRGLLLADGLFETMLAIGGAVFRRADHMRRLSLGAETLRLPLDLAAVERAVDGLAARLRGPSVIRVTVTRGPGDRGLAVPAVQRPVVFAAASAWSSAAAFGEQRLAVSSIRRNDASPLSRVKSLAYLDNVLALDEARAAGADDALMLSTAGRVACTSAANVFAVIGDDLVTPPVADGVLPGTIRALLLGAAPALGLRGVERSLGIPDLLRADAVLTTNTVRLVSPVVGLDGAPIGTRRRGAAADLAQAVRAAVSGECGAFP